MPRNVDFPLPEPSADPNEHHHTWVVYCEQKWRWRVYVRCARCDEPRHYVHGAWWRKSDAEEIVDRTIKKLEILGQ